MGRCATCGKRIGVFGGKWRKIDGRKHCTDCAPGVMAHRREAARQAILADRAPQVVLAAPVVSRDLDYPANYRRYTGALMLTDKGVIFAQTGEYKKSQSGGALFGVAGAVYDALAEKGRRDAAAAGLTGAVARDPAALLEEAEQLFLFRLEDIAKLKANSRTCQLKAGKRTVVFRWIDGRRTIRPRRDLLETYVRAVNACRDVMGDCAPFLQR